MAEQALSNTGDSAPSPIVETAADTDLSAREGEDRIAALFGDPDAKPAPAKAEEGNEADEPGPDDVEGDEPEAEPDGEASEDPETPEDEENPDGTYTDGQFVPDGGKVKMPDGRMLTVAELKEFADTRAKELQSGVSKKIAELSAKEQEISQLQERLEKEREFTLEYAKAILPPEPEMPSVSAQVDPVAWSVYAQQKAERDNLIAWNNQLEAQKKAKDDETRIRTEAEAKQHAEAQRARFFEVFPALKDDGKRAAFWDRLSSRAIAHYGVTKEAVLGLNDVDMVRILNDAVQFRELNSKSSQTKKEVGNKPTLVPGSGKRQTPGVVEQRSHQGRVQRLRETGSKAAAEAAILDFLK
jgi:hypothetical protein